MLLVDSHVHIHDCFRLSTFLESAWANFRVEADRWGQADAFMGILLLAETSNDSWFQLLASYAHKNASTKGNAIDSWDIHPTHENSSLYAQHGDDQTLFLIAGRQIVTVEGLEVLALITGRQFEDGRPLGEVIRAVKETGAIPTIAWGFGKWTGTRGRIVRKTLEDSKPSELFLGDNGGRAAFLPKPSHFRLAEKKGIRILRGSDPLSLTSEYRRVGRFGIYLNCTVSPKSPARDLRRLLMDSSTQFQAYGRPEHLHLFFRTQLLILIKNRLKVRKTCFRRKTDFYFK